MKKDRLGYDETHYKKMKRKVLKRDGRKCIICGSRKDLILHHLDSWDWFEFGRYEPMNCVTLCGGKDGCHEHFHREYGKGNNTIYQFDQFLIDNFNTTLAKLAPKRTK